MKILNSKNKNFDKLLGSLLLKRKKRLQTNSVSVTRIIYDVKRNGDKALLNPARIIDVIAATLNPIPYNPTSFNVK